MSRTSVWITLPKTAWPTASGSTPARLTASRTTVAARSHGGTGARPPPYFPIAVRVADKTKTSLAFPMAFLQSADPCSHVQAAVDGPDLPGDIGGLVSGQEADHPGDFLRLAEASHGYLRANPVEHLVGNGGEHVRGDKAGCDGVDRQPDSVTHRALRTAELEDSLLRQCLRQPEQARLGRGVVGLADVPCLPDNRGHVDDPAGAAPDHVVYGGLRHEERARQVDRDHLAPVIVGHLGDGPVDRDSGVVQQDVQAAVLLDDLVQHPAAVRCLADVSLVQRYPPSGVLGGHGCGELLRALPAAPVAGRDLGTVGGESLADGRANAAGAAGDQCHPAPDRAEPFLGWLSCHRILPFSRMCCQSALAGVMARYGAPCLTPDRVAVTSGSTDATSGNKPPLTARTSCEPRTKDRVHCRSGRYTSMMRTSELRK